MDSGTVQDQIEYATLRGWHKYNIADIQTLRYCLEACQFYLEFEPGHDDMIGLIDDTLKRTFDPDFVPE